MKSEISAVLKLVQLPYPQWHLELTEGERTCLEDPDCFERPKLTWMTLLRAAPAP
jgi:hypothetical protein